MKFYCVRNRGSNIKSIDAFKNACNQLEVEFYDADPSNFDSDILESITSEDLVYRLNNDNNCKMLEALIIGKGAKSLFKNSEGIVAKGRVTLSALINNIEGISVMKTEYLMSQNRDIIRKQVERLNGYPIVVKVLNGTGGVGVIKVDSDDSLVSLTDFLINRKESYILREFIDIKYYGRLIVLGGKVIASKQNIKPEDDFRTNNGQPIPYEFSSEINNEAVMATESIGVDFGGVDVLIDKNDNYYIAEVNYPCNFINTQLTTGVDIASQIVEFLKNKS